jgi:nucleotide-binding universal stress UspA family protein
MTLKHIVVAADESEPSRQGIRTALAWARRLGASVTLYHVAARVPAVALAGGARHGPDAPEALEAWVETELASRPEQVMPALVTGHGLPGVEIPRYAETADADLLVIGRKPRSPMLRLFEGDTADAVARRSTVPCLFIRRPLLVPARMLVALDGTDRGMRVLGPALAIGSGLESRVTGVTVERTHAGEPAALADTVRTARTANLERGLNGSVESLVVRRGEPATEIMHSADAVGADVIVIGYRRGGPPGVIEGGSVARRVAHEAPCAVLTVPL